MTRAAGTCSNDHTNIQSLLGTVCITLLLFIPLLSKAQGFVSIAALKSEITTKNTGDKPQSKVWSHEGKWWTVFANSDGTFIWRLDGTAWTKALKISPSSTVKADCKVVGNATHILLWRKEEYPSQLISVEYDLSLGNYKRWIQRPTTIYLTLDAGVEIATLDIDNSGRMWVASDAIYEINVRWSDPPYSTWSLPITVASNIKDDDIGAVIALPALHKIAVFWSDQHTKRFGFKTHEVGDNPATWSADEIPASSDAMDNVGMGFADDHFHLTTTQNGTLFCAVKTGYDKQGYPLIGLLKREPDGTWDHFYEATQFGTRPTLIINEEIGKLKIIFTAAEDGGDILYTESSISNIAFSTPAVLIAGMYSNATSVKATYTNEVVILASNSTDIVGVLARDPLINALPSAPILVAPNDQASDIPTATTLQWTETDKATSYRLQVSTHPEFDSLIIATDNITATFQTVTNLSLNTTYYWRVQAANLAGVSEWSAARSFSTIASVPLPPSLLTPLDGTKILSELMTLTWNVSPTSLSSHVQISSTATFEEIVEEARNLPLATFAPSLLQQSTPYYWRVRCENSAGFSDWSPYWMFTTYSPVINEAIGRWKMDEAGGNLLLDDTRFNNLATLQGAPERVPGISGLAIRQNGTTQFSIVQNADILNPANGITVAAWIRPERMASQYIVQKGITVDGYQMSLLSTGKVSFQINQVSTQEYKANSKALYPMDGQTWMHVAGTFDGNTLKLYVNGQLDKSITFAAASLIHSNEMPVSIGAKADGKSSFKGTLDEVSIFNYAKSAGEIATLFTLPSSARMVVRHQPTQDQPQNPGCYDVTTSYPFLTPNPVQDTFLLTFEPGSGLANCATITITDGKGWACASAISGTIQGDEIELTLRDMNLPAGYYLMTVATPRYKRTIRFIKL